MTISIAPAEPCDAVEIARVINAAYRVEDFFKFGDRTNARDIAELLLRETFLLAREADGDIAGVVRVHASGERGHFGMLSVAPAHQGTGLGRALVKAAEEFARERGCTAMDLEVASPRTELPPFYHKLGYAASGTGEWPAEALHELRSPAYFIIMSRPL